MKTKNLIFIAVLLISSIFSAKAQVTKIMDFAGTSNGKEPLGGLITDGTFLYGMTQWGGTNNKGVVFKVKPDGTEYSTLTEFDGTAKGSEPQGTLLLSGDYLYGTTITGGTNNNGVIFKIKPDGTGFTKIYDFVYAQARYLYSDGSNLFGISTTGNGVNNQDVGFIYKIDFDGSNFTVIHVFTVSEAGNLPDGYLLPVGSDFYGVTSRNIFKINKNGTGLSFLHLFEEATTGTILNSLTTDGTFLYGTTSYGGANNSGTIFKIKLDGTNFETLRHLDYTPDGSQPDGPLFLSGNTLIGMANSGGAQGAGTIFSIKTDGTNFTRLYSCEITNYKGSNPRGGFTMINNLLYGMMQLGGTNYVGTIIKFQTTLTDVSDNINSEKINVYPIPASKTLNIESNIKIDNFILVNIAGQIIEQNTITNNQINVSEISKGIYQLVLITKDKKQITKTIVIE